MMGSSIMRRSRGFAARQLWLTQNSSPVNIHDVLKLNTRATHNHDPSDALNEKFRLLSYATEP